MRRLMAITAFALFLVVPVWAQRGGGGHGGGFGGGHGGGFAGHAGFSGGHTGFSGGHVGGARSFSGVRSPGVSRGFTRLPSPRAGLARGPFLHDEFRGSRFVNRGFRNFGYGNFRIRNNCYGYGCWGYGYGYPWWYGGIDPWWWDSGSSYDEDYERDRDLANEMNEQSLEEQQMLRQEQIDGDQDVYGRPPRREQEKPEPEGAAFMPATVLVFRDQHRQEVQNYAIVGQTLWAFAPQHQKIALSELDLAATTKANDDRGLNFRVPSASEAQ